MIAAKPASAPTELMKWWTEKANGSDPMLRPQSTWRIRASSAGRRDGAAARELRDLLGERGRVALEHEQVDLREALLDPRGIERVALGAQDLLRRASAAGARRG